LDKRGGKGGGKRPGKGGGMGRAGPVRSGRAADPVRPGRAAAHVRPKQVKNPSSRRWLERQLNDPYVRAAKAGGYRSRAAFKLMELDDKFRFLRQGATVLDLGAAPGGWSQVARARVGPAGRVVAADILEMEPIPGVEILRLDLLQDAAAEKLKLALRGKAQVVLSDMAASTTGHRATDHLRTLALLEAALDLADAVLAPGGAFVGKVFQGGTTGDLLSRIKRRFREVRHVKPPASRAESVELYLVATGFRG
jgi:23S rRNA (uridine2552-2'-O)-methyltransferase